jgi:hypothetical protein
MHQTSVIRGKYYLDKRCTNMGESIMLKNTMKKKVLCNISMDQNSKIE